MTITVSVTKDVTDLTVTENETSLVISPNTIELGVVDVAFNQASTADAIGLDATGHITATTVQGALDEIGADPQFTDALKNKLDNVQAEANKLTAGTNVNISEGAINADVLGALQAGNNISISATGEISASAVSLTDVYTADDQDEHLGLTPTPNQGDVVIRTDENKTYIHNGGTAGTMSDYTELAQSSGVNSVNGATGVVTLASTDLSDYAANKYIDWTASQAQDIHADNYITYSAGENITIDENNQISSTGGGTTNTAGDGINIDDGEINLDPNHRYSKIAFNHVGTDIDSGSFIQPFPKDLGAPYVDYNGIGFYNTNSVTGEVNLLGAFTNDLTFTSSTISVEQEYQINQNTFASSVPSDDDKYVNDNIRSMLSENVGCTTPDNNNVSNKIANTEFVRNVVSEAGNLGLPETPQNARVLTYQPLNDSGLIWTRPEPFLVGVNSESVDNQVAIYVFDLSFNYSAESAGGDGTLPEYFRVRGTNGITIDYTGGTLIFGVTNDGLPVQSAETDGYVLTSTGESGSAWVDLSTASLPAQGDYAGKFLTTNGTSASWADVDAYPDQTGNSGKFLTTDGLGEVSWGDVDAFPEQSGSTYGKYLRSGSDGAVWLSSPDLIPDQDGNSGKYLTTNGNAVTWETINTAGQTGNISFSSSTISSSDTDTVTVDDNLTATGTLTTDNLILSGTNTPSVVSGSSYEITAPDGVTVNSCELPRFQQLVELDADHENDHAYTNNYTYITTKLLRGESQFEISVNLGSEIPINANNSYLEATWVQRGGTYEKVNVDIHRLSGYSYRIKLTDSSGGIANIPNGNLLIKIYEIF